MKILYKLSKKTKSMMSASRYSLRFISPRWTSRDASGLSLNIFGHTKDLQQVWVEELSDFLGM